MKTEKQIYEVHCEGFQQYLRLENLSAFVDDHGSEILKLKIVDDPFLCLDCGTDTSVGDDNYYMLDDLIWTTINPKISGMLCWKCMEKRVKKCFSLDLFSELFMVCGATEENRNYQKLLERKR